jgi:UDP-N-acetylmuramate dehydrogenase
MVSVQNDFNLIEHNTFKLNSVARYFAELTDIADLGFITKFAEDKKVSIRVLGGGSNLILPEKIDALVVHNKLLGTRIVQETIDTISVACSSGMNWHQFVMSTIASHQYGLENLALIPGTVGGAPIQNVGAYGVEVNRFISRVHGYDFETGTTKSLQNNECLFEYRHSVFKTPAFKNFFITEVEFQLLKKANPVISYAELAQAFPGLPARPQDVAQKVIEIRTKKLPDVNVIPNVGSFFKNPIVSAQQLSQLEQATPDLVSYPQPNGQFKLAAGQLIDKLGFKGRQQGNVSMYDRQALVMVNLGSGRHEDVVKLADCVRQACLEVFGVTLETEPIFW